MRLHDTLTGCLQPLIPLRPGQIRLYVCGPTVYDHAHLGHARSAVIFDVLVRHLAEQGLAVTYIRNVTDIDDKLTARSRLTGRTAAEIAEAAYGAYRSDMARLKVRPPDAEPRATAHLDDMIAAVARILESGHGYAAGGNVYFSTASDPSYGRLSGRGGGTASRSRGVADASKRDPADFALWRACKPGEPGWDAPFGRGRPGWHIECTAMAHAFLGTPFDIHGGGQDLIFPHHENEIAQSRAAFGAIPARFWIHHGLVTAGAAKMAKSAGNGIRIREILDAWPPEAVRLYLLSRRYRRPLAYDPGKLRACGIQIDRLHRSMQRALRLSGAGEIPRVRAGKYWERFRAALEDDLNTPMAIAELLAALRAQNRVMGVLTGTLTGDRREELLRTAGQIRAMMQQILGDETAP